MSYEDDIKLFALNSNTPLAQKIAGRIGVLLAKSSVQRFSDREIQINVDRSVHGRNVHLIQSTNAPANDNLTELLIMINVVKRISARAINVILPYCGYARQDRRTRTREPVTAKLIANMLGAAGATRIPSPDLCTPRIQGFFDIPADNLVEAPLLADYFSSNRLGRGAVIVSSDHGGTTRAGKLAEFLKAPIAIVSKRRPKANVAGAMDIIGNVSRKRAIIIDDMIDTTSTITLTAQVLVDVGATKVYASAAHAVLPGPATDRFDNSKIKSLVLTDSINQPEEKRIGKLQLVSVGPLMDDAVKLIEQYQSVSLLFNTHYREN